MSSKILHLPNLRASGSQAAPLTPDAEPPKKLSMLDSYLTVWILAAAALGVALGNVEGVSQMFSAASSGTTNLPIAAGLILMMWPPLAKVKYDKLTQVLQDWKLLTLSLVQNWIIGPGLMFVLAATFLKNYPAYMEGLILIGLARCIAMVVVWNELAEGDNEYCATIVAFNSIFQVVMYSLYAAVFLKTLPEAMGLAQSAIQVTTSEIACSVCIYLGVPFLLGFLTWAILRKVKGDEWYYGTFCPQFGKLTLASLLYTIVIMFALQGQQILSQPWQMVLVGTPMLIYFLFMFALSFLMTHSIGASYKQSVTLAFTAASNNFELAIAVAVGSFGITSAQAFVGVLGPLIEIPVMLLLVNLAFWFRKSLTWAEESKRGSLVDQEQNLKEVLKLLD